MPLPAAITDLNVAAGSNSPPGGEALGGNMDDYLKAAFAFIAQLRDGPGFTGDVTLPSNRLVLLQTGGHLGLGASPTAITSTVRTLEIRGPAATIGGGIALKTSDLSQRASFYVNGGVAFLGTSSSHPLSLTTNDLVRAQVKASGSFRLVGLAADPASPDPGELYFNSTTGKFRGHTGAAWVDLH